jgi:hypothetical protein
MDFSLMETNVTLMVELAISFTYNYNYIRKNILPGGEIMGQVTIYLDPETEEKLDQITKKSGLSRSKWVADLIREKTSEVWPDHVRSLAGAWPDLPVAEEIRERKGSDLPRERF